MARPKPNSDGIDLGYLLSTITRYWYIFALSALVGLGVAYYLIKSSVKIYAFKASVLVGPKVTGSKYASGEEVLDARMDRLEVRNVEDEMGIIVSLDNIRAVIQRNSLGVAYYLEKNLKPEEIYDQAHYQIEIDSSAYQYTSVPIYIKFLSARQCKLSLEFEEGNLYNYKTDESKTVKNFRYEKIVKIGELEPKLGLRVITRPDFDPTTVKGRHFFVLKTVSGMARTYQNKITVKPTAKETNLLNLTIEGEVPQKQIDFLDTLMAVYIQNDLIQKNRQGKLTLQFINEELAQAREELTKAEAALEAYKSQRAIPDIDRVTGIESNNFEMLRLEKKELEARLRNYQNVYNYFIKNREAAALVPTNYDSGDPTANVLINALSKKNQDKAALVGKVKENHPSMQALNAEINNIKDGLKEYLENNINAVRSKLGEVNLSSEQAYNKITTIPQDYRRIEDLERDFNFKKVQYEKLLEKRNEARIRLATNIPDNRVVDRARMAGNGPIAPNNKLILAISLFISLAIPFVAILVLNYFLGTINTKEDIFRHTSLPLLATLTHMRQKSPSDLPIVIEQPRSLTAESFRLLKIEIDKLLPNDLHPWIIGISSAINREGKTFCATNLSCTFAQQGIKTLLLGVDLYKGESLLPNLDEEKSLYHYALGKNSVTECIQSTGIENLDVVNPGPALANPSIFLQSKSFALLMEDIRSRYPVIIIDSSPLGFVSDFLVVEKYTNLNLFVLRVGRSRIKYLDNLHDLHEKKMLNRLQLILNDVRYASAQQLSPFGWIRRKNPYYHNS
ncbi:MAG: tyrosine-protein kinase domain-containing protein [Microscillaceae bacterium]